MPEPRLDFFDSNVCLGLPMKHPAPGVGPVPASAWDLLAAMDRAGVARALVWHAAQADHDPGVGNEWLARAIAGQDRLAGCWTVLPSQTRELGDPDHFMAAAAERGIRAFRAFPNRNRYLLRREVLGDLLDRMAAARVPLVLRPTEVGWNTIYDLLAQLPELTVILTDMGAWGCDRYFRPLLDMYAHVYVETSGHITDGGVESFVADYGPDRLLFGSGFPAAYMGAMMLAIAHAEIAPADRQAIAGGNLARLLGEVRL